MMLHIHLVCTVIAPSLGVILGEGFMCLEVLFGHMIGGEMSREWVKEQSTSGHQR